MAVTFRCNIPKHWKAKSLLRRYRIADWTKFWQLVAETRQAAEEAAVQRAASAKRERDTAREIAPKVDALLAANASDPGYRLRHALAEVGTDLKTYQLGSRKRRVPKAPKRDVLAELDAQIDDLLA